MRSPHVIQDKSAWQHLVEAALASTTARLARRRTFSTECNRKNALKHAMRARLTLVNILDHGTRLQVAAALAAVIINRDQLSLFNFSVVASSVKISW